MTAHVNNRWSVMYRWMLRIRDFEEVKEKIDAAG